jgi:predicted transcriptional regulator
MNASQQKEDRLTLEVLSAVDDGDQLSQRRLASQMGVALGLANSYIKRCVRKGLIKINEAPANRYAYYLTPKGFTEKSRLTAGFLSSSLDFYRKAADSCSTLFDECESAGVRQVVLCGDSDLAEIAFLRALDKAIEVTGLYDPKCNRQRFFDRPVWREFDDVKGVARVVTCVNDPMAWQTLLESQSPSVPVYVPDVLGLAKQ